MKGYSDRISHAFLFAAKHRGGVDGANVALMLTAHGCDEVTVVAGILHHVLEHARPQARQDLEQKIAAKFGPVVLAVVCDAVEPGLDGQRPWRAAKADYLDHLTGAEPRALDIAVADELYWCGATVSALGRYGREYQRTVTRANGEDALWWYRELLDRLASRPDWRRPEMLADLRRSSAELVKALRDCETDL